MKTIVIGGGIVGLCTAWALRKQGIDVTVIEAGRVPCATAASSDHHRLTRPFYGAAHGYAARMPAAFDAFETLFEDLPAPRGRYYVETGMVVTSRERGDYADLSRQSLDRIGEPYTLLETEAEIAQRLPMLEPEGITYAMLGRGGALMADTILRDLAFLLRSTGVPVVELSPVTRLDTAEGIVHLASGDSLRADRVILCAGTGLSALLPGLNIPLTPRRTLIVYADPPADLADAWAQAPGWIDLGGPTDYWGLPPVAGLPLKLGNGLMGRDDPDDSDRQITRDEMIALRESYRGLFRDIDGFRLRWGQANYWMKAPEHRFILRREGRVLAASADSGHGFKFGALSGIDIAEAVVSDDVDGVAVRMAGGDDGGDLVGR